MTQERMDQTTEPSRAARNYQTPDIDASLSRATNVMKKVRVVHGANEQYFDNLEGKTVGTVRKSLRDIFNIPGDAEALIAGKTVGDDFILEGGQNLEFVKEAGVKGLTLTLSEDEVTALRWTLTEDLFEDECPYINPFASHLLERVLGRLGGEIDAEPFTGQHSAEVKKWYAEHEMCESCDRWLPKSEIIQVEEGGFTFPECKRCNESGESLADWGRIVQDRLGELD